ncbi:hypothetical protein [Klebsiella pneumoniae]|uniref:hypothetical protein n=1 Tax=Klebsiella pneumoniae TaxID=573 RepID=UPI00388DCA82
MSAILPDNFAFSFCRPLKNLYTPADRTYLPGLIKVENMTAIHVPDDKNAVMAVFRCGDDMAQNPFGSRVKLRPNGTNADIIAVDVVSVINNPVVAQNASPTVYMPGEASAWDTVGTARHTGPVNIHGDRKSHCVTAIHPSLMRRG